jgi:predicted  nucleic acid-binding Zn-ribbon protein
MSNNQNQELVAKIKAAREERIKIQNLLEEDEPKLVELREKLQEMRKVEEAKVADIQRELNEVDKLRISGL